MATTQDESAPAAGAATGEKFKPVGTLALMLAVAGFMLVGWLFLYYAVFLHRGFIQ